jgi:hypothetical protein
MQISEAHHAVQIALGTCVKSRLLSAAKAELPERSSQTVELTAKITGLLTKGSSTPGNSGTEPANVSLASYGVLLGVLAHLGIGPTRLQNAIEVALEHVKAPGDLNGLATSPKAQKLAAAIDAASDQLNARLPEQPFTTNGRAATVRFDPQSITILESTPSCTQSSKTAA